MGTYRKAATSAKTENGATGVGSSADREWYSVELTHGCTMARFARTLWQLEYRIQPVLPLAQPDDLGSGAGGLEADGDLRGELDWEIHYLDGSVVRVYQPAAGAKKAPRQTRPLDAAVVD